MTVIWGMIDHVSKGRHAIPAFDSQKTIVKVGACVATVDFIDRKGPVADQDGLFFGRWQSTPGKWRAIHTEWEYCHILSDISVLTPDGHPPKTLRAGDSFIIPRGFSGTWEVVETTLKDYVIRP